MQGKQLKTNNPTKTKAIEDQQDQHWGQIPPFEDFCPHFVFCPLFPPFHDLDKIIQNSHIQLFLGKCQKIAKFFHIGQKKSLNFSLSAKGNQKYLHFKILLVFLNKTLFV
jgi:hypothetical protein